MADGPTPPSESDLLLLLSRSSSLLHGIDGVDWRAVLDPRPDGGVATRSPSAVPGDDGGSDDSDSDGDSDSSDDDGGGMLMIGGGYSSSDDDEACDGDGGGDCDGEPTRIQSDPNPDEDESALLRRASTLHAGLLISIECGSGADGIVAGVVSGGGGRVASLLRSVLTAPPGAGPRSVTRELWNKVRLTNALLAVQYLLHLRSTSTVVGEGGAANGGGLDGWNAVTLPLLFLSTGGGANVLRSSHALREAALSLSSPGDNGPGDAPGAAVRRAADTCSAALDRAVAASDRASVDAACRALLSLRPSFPGGDRGAASAVADALHAASLGVIRGVRRGDLPGDCLRIATGLVLPGLYPQSDEGAAASAEDAAGEGDRRDELWDEILSLLGPGGETGDDDAGCASAMMSASALLCAVLPSFRRHDLPAAGADRERTRPALQHAVWAFVRSCLGRRGDALGAGGGGRGSTSLRSDGPAGTGSDQLLRRRGAHILRLLVEHERELRKAKAGGARGADGWTKYVLCFEMLEMEFELHLVDQVWSTVREISSGIGDCSGGGDASTAADAPPSLPPIGFGDLSSLLDRVLLAEAPTMRKLGLYRLLNGDAGIDDPSAMTVDFVVGSVLRSYDSIVGTKVGNNMQVGGEDGGSRRVNLPDMVSSFLGRYVSALSSSDDGGVRLSDLVRRIYGREVLGTCKSRSLLLFYGSVSSALGEIPDGSARPSVEPDDLVRTVRSVRGLFSSGGAPRSMQEAIKLGLATVLECSRPWARVKDVDAVLQVLTLYPPDDDDGGRGRDGEAGPRARARDAVSAWVRGLGDGSGWAASASPALASAFVSGQLVPYPESGDEPLAVDAAERDTAGAVCRLASLSSGTASEALWPAIFRGLGSPSSAPGRLTSSPGARRSLLLLEFGCRENAISGMGNGDLVLDPSGGFMMPPPPPVESVLGSAADLVLSRLSGVSDSLLATTAAGTARGGGRASGATRSALSSNVSALVAVLVSQLRVLSRSYPSSDALSGAVDAMLGRCADALSGPGDGGGSLKSLVLLFGALTCGGDFSKKDKLRTMVVVCNKILSTELSFPSGIKKDSKQACRSIFQYAKWGSLSLILPMIRESDPSGELLSLVEDTYQSIVKDAKTSVDATPVVALPPLFSCAVEAGEFLASLENPKSPLLSSLESISTTLFAVLKEDTSSSDWTNALNTTCDLMFKTSVLQEEYRSSYLDGSGPMPAKRAFDTLIRMGGDSKPYIVKACVSRISVAWLGPVSGEVGLSAIPYRDDIVRLLLFKEPKFEESASHQSVTEKPDALPEATHQSSVTRAFVMSFFSKLPAVGDLSNTVLVELVQYVIKRVLDLACLQPAKGKAFISGSDEYARITRSWQALCLLSRFVTEDIAQQVADKAFSALSNNLHGEIRYFMEVFLIQSTRIHPDVFGTRLIEDIQKPSLTLQQVSSLLIIGGNLTIGRYSCDFFRSSKDVRMKGFLVGALPWLSSTQGFSRAIAQLLCHSLIPQVVDVSVELDRDEGNQLKDESVLRSVYTFLEENSDMSRLRKKQEDFFQTYDVDSVTTLGGLLSIPVGDGEEANPEHKIDAIKECLAETYDEAHVEDAPVWKQMEDLLINADCNQALGEEENEGIEDEAQLVNFQRKILPIDALDLALRSISEQHLHNAAGKQKQKLVVCATLVDKVPNLAGLARTCEIFSASTLVMPNVQIRKQDDFKSISASADGWIDLEEVKEGDLLGWLHQKKSEGYSIVGLEQTASSKCLTRMKFSEKTVLLLGKEKEGIPIEFLSAVDQCIEIPQLGIIRSLNVHVSGAITVWEYTKQQLKGRKNKIGTR